MTENLLEIAKKQFADVKLGFDVNKSLQYNLGVESLQSTLRLINTPEALQFADKYLYQIVNILLDQGPSKIGAFEKGKIIDSLNLSIDIIVKLLPSNPQFITVLARIFDNSSAFYAGSKTYYHHYPGYPHVRVELAGKFAGLNGFALLYQALYVPEIRWPGAANVLHLIRVLNNDEILGIVSDEVRNQFIEKTMAVLLNLTDEQLKKENCDSITTLLRTMCHLSLYQGGARLKFNDPKGLKKLEPYFTFWFGFVHRLMNSGSLVLKLFAWDVAQDLVSYAQEIRPVPRSYVVEGSSVDFINGNYDFVKLDKNIPVYEKLPTRPSDPVVTLLRFSMKDKSYRWFLSTVKPGTQDIDYFEDMTSNADRRLPSSREWHGLNHYVTAIPPTLQRVGNLVNEGVVEESLLHVKLAAWAIDNDIISQVFGQNMHREIIARSDRLLTFLAELNSIKATHIHQIWKAGFQSTAEDITDEIWSLLVGLSVNLDNSLFQVIVDLAFSQLNKDEAGFLRVANFIEKFTKEQYKYLQQFQRIDSSPLLLNLIWEVYKSPFFSSLKSAAVIQDLLSRCLQFKCGNAFVLERIRESAAALGKLRSPNAENVYLPADEVTASQIILNLMFLTSKQIDESVVLTLYDENFPRIIINEIDRFVQTNKHRDQLSEPTSTPYAVGIANRLNILRRFFGLSQTIKITSADVETLWKLLSRRAEDINEFLTFLMNGAQSQEEIRPFCDNETFF